MKIVTALILVATGLSLAGCSSEDRPSKTQLKTALLHIIPGHLQVNTFDIEAMQNLGNKVEPDYAVRFHAIVANLTDLYQKDDTDAAVVFVRLTTTANTSTPLFGKIRSRLYQGSWRHDVVIDGDPFPRLGAPLNQFTANRVIIRGSEDEKRYNQDRGYSVSKSADGQVWTVTFLTDALIRIAIPYTKGRGLMISGAPDGEVQWPYYKDRSQFVPIPMGAVFTDLTTHDLEMKYKTGKSVTIVIQ